MFNSIAFIDLDDIIRENNFDKMQKTKIKAEELLKEISESFNCEIRIFIAKRDGIAQVWIQENNLDIYVRYLKNKQEYTYIILDFRCYLIDELYLLFNKIITEFVSIEMMNYHVLKNENKTDFLS